jgi:hypothetical protein
MENSSLIIMHIIDLSELNCYLSEYIKENISEYQFLKFVIVTLCLE